MSQPAPINPLAYIVAQVAEAAELDPEVHELRKPDHGPREFLLALAEQERHVDALKFLAHLLPRREAVWWAWLCASKGSEKYASPEERAALAATERWIGQPTESNRRAAMEAGTEATFETAAGCAALAAFLSAGSMAPPDLDEVPPPRYAAARVVFGSLVLAAVRVEPENSPEKFKKYLADGLKLAERIDLWNSVERVASGAQLAQESR